MKTTEIKLGILLVVCIVITSVSTTILGKEKSRVIAIENRAGLQVKVPKNMVNLGNLVPGDNRECRFEVSNKGTSDITVFIRTNILGEETDRGGYLADVMNLTIRDGRSIIADGLLRSTVERENILIGTIAPGISKILDLSTYLPEKETGNEYQGAYMKVGWTFITQTSPIGGGGSGGSNDRGVAEDKPQPPVDYVIIEDNLIPMGNDEPIISHIPQGTADDNEVPNQESDITIEDHEVPLGVFQLPRTGQLTSMYFYGVGILMIMLGVGFKRKNE